MDIEAAFPSKYLKASDLQGTTPTVVISHVAMEEVGRDKETRPVLYFNGKQKGVVLNKTNATNISVGYGRNTDAWVGKAVTLFTAMVDFQGQTGPAIRIRPASQQPAPQQPAPQQQQPQFTSGPPAHHQEAPHFDAPPPERPFPGDDNIPF